MTIRSSADLRNNYNEVSQFCHSADETVYITKNGKGDLAIMSIESYERLMSRCELANLLHEGLEQVQKGQTQPLDDFLTRWKRHRADVISG